jgi:hypothetical protein
VSDLPPAGMTPSESTGEPVMTVEWWKTAITSLLLAIVAVLGALDVWHPTDDQVTAFASAGAVLVAIVFPIVAFFVRRRVTPVKES